jgi:hypothetical protein
MLKCENCGKEIEKSNYMHYTVCSNNCFTDMFWKDKIEIKDDPRTVRINGQHFYIGKEDKKGNPEWRGFAGKLFIIKFNDRRIVKTTNLWYNGTIPEKFRKELQDNAELMSCGKCKHFKPWTKKEIKTKQKGKTYNGDGKCKIRKKGIYYKDEINKMCRGFSDAISYYTKDFDDYITKAK